MKELKIHKLSDAGVGIAYDGNDEIYIKNALPNEIILTDIKDYFVKGSKRREGVAKEIIKSSQYRCQPVCSHFLDCGSCHIQHLNTSSQHELKLGAIKDAVKHLNVDEAICPNILSAICDEEQRITRNKSIRKFSFENNRIICGFYEPYSHRVIEIENCAVEPLWFSSVCIEMCEIFFRHNIQIYNECEDSGSIRAVLIRQSGNERLLMLYTAARADGALIEILKGLKEKYNIRVVAICYLQGRTNSLNSGDISYLSSDKVINAHIGDYIFKIGAATFMQVNDKAMELMYKEAVDFVCQAGSSFEALDLCCGVGTMTLPLSRYFSHVTGVEIVRESIDAAVENALLNNISNVDFICEDMALYLEKSDLKNVRAIIADPSRAGLGEKNCKAICELKQDLYVALIFCSLKALSRDLPYFIKAGFRVHKIVGVDMFEHTMHVETVCLLSRVKT